MEEEFEEQVAAGVQVRERHFTVGWVGGISYPCFCREASTFLMYQNRGLSAHLQKGKLPLVGTCDTADKGRNVLRNQGNASNERVIHQSAFCLRLSEACLQPRTGSHATVTDISTLSPSPPMILL